MSDKVTLVESLVAAAAEKDAVSFAEMFKTELADRIQERLANLKVRIASQMAGASASEEQVEESNQKVYDARLGGMVGPKKLDKLAKAKAEYTDRKTTENAAKLDDVQAKQRRERLRGQRGSLSNSYEPEGDELPEAWNRPEREAKRANLLKDPKYDKETNRRIVAVATSKQPEKKQAVKDASDALGGRIKRVPREFPSHRVGEPGGSISKSDADAGAKPLDPLDPVVQNRIPSKSVAVSKRTFEEPTGGKKSVNSQRTTHQNRKAKTAIEKMKAIQATHRLKK